MNLNLTLLGEIITFAVLVWFTLKFIWPPLTKAMAERQQKIADGLAAAERGHYSLGLARAKIAEQFRQAKGTTQDMLSKAEQQVIEMLEEGTVRAQHEEAQMLANAKMNVAQEILRSKKQLQKVTTEVAVKVAEAILQSEIDVKKQEQLIQQMLETLAKL